MRAQSPSELARRLAAFDHGVSGAIVFCRGRREGEGFNQRDVDLPVGRKERRKSGREGDAMVEMARVAMMDRYIDGRTGRTRTGRERDD